MFGSMNTRLLACLLTIFAFSSCSKIHESDKPSTPAVTADSLIHIEEAFSKLSEDKGFHTALKSYMASDATKLVEGHYPIVGSDSIAKILVSRPDTGVIMTWKPRKADIAASGDLGYTWGDWMFRPKHAKAGDTAYGNYFTIWKRQGDGSWKWVLDGGNTTPKP